jgi:polar amino acid transport system substrate-binding protein
MLKGLLRGALAVAAMALLVPTSGDARTLDEIIKAGTLKIGVHPNLEPLSFKNPAGEWQGYDVDLGNRIAQLMGVQAEFVATETPNRVPNIVSGIIDISMGGLTRTVDRMKVIDYTFPIHTESMAALTTEKYKAVTKIMEFNDAKFTMVGCRGCTPAKWTEDNLPKAKLILVEGAAEIVRTVAQGRADAVVANLDYYPVLMRNYPDVKWVILPEVVRTAYCGIGLTKGNDALRTVLNAALYQIQSNDEHNKMWQKHFNMRPITEVKAQPYW